MFVRFRPTAYSLRPTAFTLTEMLVVIAIIAILASLTTVAVMRAMDTAKQTRQKVEVDAIDAAFKAYKEKYGSYPPCDLRFRASANRLNGMFPDPYFNTALRQHLARAFPRYSWTPATLESALTAAGVDTENYRPDQALVFWLNGFNPDITQPFYGLSSLTKSGRTAPFFDFDSTRLAVRDSRSSPSGLAVPSYFPSGPKMTTTPSTPYQIWNSGCAPYVYIDAHPYLIKEPGGNIVTVPFYGPLPYVAIMPGVPVAVANAFNATSSPSLPTVSEPIKPPPALGTEVFPEAGVAMAYWNDLNGNGNSCTGSVVDSNEDWINPDSFQIIAPGGDGKYRDPNTPAEGSPYFCARMYPTGMTERPNPGTNKSISSNDDDNVTNFCNKARLGDAKP